MADAKPPKPAKVYPLVAVLWEDAALKDAGTWHSVEEGSSHAYEPVLMRTVGFLLSKTRKGIVLTHTHSEDGSTMAPRDQIPAGMVRSITPLQPKAD